MTNWYIRTIWRYMNRKTPLKATCRNICKNGKIKRRFPFLFLPFSQCCPVNPEPALHSQKYPLSVNPVRQVPLWEQIMLLHKFWKKMAKVLSSRHWFLFSRFPFFKWRWNMSATSRFDPSKTVSSILTICINQYYAKIFLIMKERKIFPAWYFCVACGCYEF